MRRHVTILVALALSGALGCAANTSGDPTAQLVPAGKADDYYSNVATEFELRGQIAVALTEEEQADEQLRKERVSRRLTAVGLYLTGYLTAKFHGIDENGDGEITEDEVFFHNENWGGFQAMVRNYSLEETEEGALDAGTFVAGYTVDVAGPPDMLSLIPDAEQTAEGVSFSFQMPKNAEVDPGNVPRGTFRSFDPAAYGGELETVTLTGRAQPTIGNAYPQYAAFVADGVYDITLFQGHDYNTARSDLALSREAFDKLDGLGFRAPVATFDDLTADSGPFVLDTEFRGEPVRVEVRIFHSDMFEGRRQEQHDLALSEIVSRDVFFYNGHAGPYFGFYLDEAYEATVNYWEFAEAPFDADRQQLFVAQGCQTYSQYADMLYANPAKNESNLDAITTVNYSYGQGTLRLLDSLLWLERPSDFYAIIRTLNGDFTNDYHDVFYGVMGIDDNPSLHPLADLDTVGSACTADADCGDPLGNACVATTTGEHQCAVRTVADVCPEGTHAGQIAEGDTIQGRVCY